MFTQHEVRHWILKAKWWSRWEIDIFISWIYQPWPWSAAELLILANMRLPTGLLLSELSFLQFPFSSISLFFFWHKRQINISCLSLIVFSKSTANGRSWMDEYRCKQPISWSYSWVRQQSEPAKVKHTGFLKKRRKKGSWLIPNHVICLQIAKRCDIWKTKSLSVQVKPGRHESTFWLFAVESVWKHVEKQPGSPASVWMTQRFASITHGCSDVTSTQTKWEPLSNSCQCQMPTEWR